MVRTISPYHQISSTTSIDIQKECSRFNNNWPTEVYRYVEPGIESNTHYKHIKMYNSTYRRYQYTEVRTINYDSHVIAYRISINYIWYYIRYLCISYRIYIRYLMFFNQTSSKWMILYLKCPVNLLCVQNLTFMLIQFIMVISIYF